MSDLYIFRLSGLAIVGTLLLVLGANLCGIVLGVLCGRVSWAISKSELWQRMLGILGCTAGPALIVTAAIMAVGRIA